MSVEIRCGACGAVLRPEGTRCPSCGVDLSALSPASGSWGETTRRLDNPVPQTPGAATLFQPSIMVEGLFGETQATGSPTPSPTSPDGQARERPSRRFEVPAYFLMVGAPPGFERLELVSPRTVIGREGADLVLDDAKISSRHCQIDVMGREFYVLDLDSLNGTYLNGHKIRSSQILPGDTLRVGKTSLVFCVGAPGGEG